MLTFPVAVLIDGKVNCIPYIERDDLFKMHTEYQGVDLEYSGYAIYKDITGKLYATER